VGGAKHPPLIPKKGNCVSLEELHGLREAHPLGAPLSTLKNPQMI
jgi:hypothetical protein